MVPSSPQDVNKMTLTGIGDSLRRGVGSLLGNLQKLKAYTLPIAKIISVKNARAWVSMAFI